MEDPCKTCTKPHCLNSNIEPRDYGCNRTCPEWKAFLAYWDEEHKQRYSQGECETCKI